MTTTWSERLQRAEVAVLVELRHGLGSGTAVPAASAVSWFGEHARGWLVLGALGWAGGRRRREWAAGAAGVALAHASAVAAKRVVRRARPALEHVPHLGGVHSGLSFPSAHATSTAAAVVGYAPMVGRPVMVGALGAMAVSRVLLGVHWPSDVLAGALLGTAVGAGVRRVAGTGALA
ncbi:phosphatase PAP2 family protein [Modestobacter sp. VKM Ac-2986]|uniref:phosphatase PAP2 family protein n=1 Tax=Modestobacter sp. VKM Ac-2986 TaxID=3004140 RepID=UPI0022AB957B|nr:phosphatase PAP2 family protein [Modestobacter sp. VKM Ac-2986]MCZ2829741.1 phosphatase PAP2 family protein [Modestobacter sp. VKM Ac-2986]